MKVNELRIGNFVYFIFNNEKIIHSIVSKDIHVMHKCERDYNEESECYYPIPLTEDWHNKFGIKKNGFKNFVYELPLTRIAIKTIVVFTQDYVVLRSFDGDMQKPSIADNIVTIWNKDKMKRDMFVHEWQNLYHDLSGEELTIVE